MAPFSARIGRIRRIESGSDRHMLIVDRDACYLYELYAVRKVDGRWHAGSGAIWNMRRNKLRPRGWTSADAAGLPILPGLVRWDEAESGAPRRSGWWQLLYLIPLVGWLFLPER